jgi:hypothetical protein
MGMMGRIAMLLGCCGALAACVDDQAVRGELGNANFTYVCVDASDYQCLFRERGMPHAVGIGGRFALDSDESFSIRDDIQPAAPDMVERDLDAFTWREPGYVAMLLMESDGVEIEDFVHMQGAPIASLVIADDGQQDLTEVELTADDDLEVHVRPEDAEGHTLGGGFEYTWESSDEQVVRVSPGRGDNQARLSALGGGRSVVRVRLRTLEAQLVVDVSGAPFVPDGGPFADDDAGADDEDAGGDGAGDDGGTP